MTEEFVIHGLLRGWLGHERFDPSNGYQYGWLTLDQWLDSLPLTALTYPA